ncbi:hypothetical protein ElyMa_002703800 [Elysia marginata]|uniref:Uncharacterized protein n=1 Tax=Elysia marginata TaxID=1093978 RepID=A0AAV4HEE4_9GAST|nr:hypothetical protein ElyMa_002703800 [Elysia marginata]
MASNKTGTNRYLDNQTKMGEDWPYIQETSVQHHKVGSYGILREKESGAGLGVPGGETPTTNKRNGGPPGTSYRRLPKTECDGGRLLMAYALQ